MTIDVSCWVRWYIDHRWGLLRRLRDLSSTIKAPGSKTEGRRTWCLDTTGVIQMSEHEFNCGYASYFAGVSASDLDDFQASADFRAGWRTARWEEDCDDEAKPDGWWENDHVAHYDPNPEEEDLPPTWEYQFEIWMSQLNCRIHNLYIVGKDPDELPL